MLTNASARACIIATLIATAASAAWARQPAAPVPADMPVEKVPAIEGPGPIWRLSINAKGLQARGHNRRPTVSDDGRFVTFVSYADNLIAGGDPEFGQYFLRDTKGGELRRLDPPAAAGRAIVLEAVITGDGSAVIMTVGRFEEDRDTAIYRYDIQARTLESLCTIIPDPPGNTESDPRSRGANRPRPAGASLRSARTATAIPLGTERAEHLRCSRDGRIVAFCVQVDGEEPATRIATRATAIAAYDSRTGEVSIPVPSASTLNGQTRYMISADGSTILFACDEPVGDEDTNSSPDIFAHDLRSGKDERISVSSQGIEGNGPSYWPIWISPDGQRAMFRSRSTNLAGDPDQARFEQDYLRDRAVGTTSVIAGSHATLVGQRQNRLICFQPSGMQPGEAALVIRDPASKRDREFPLGNISSDSPYMLSTDGRWAVFSSSNSNLVPNDTNNRDDVFLIDVDAALPAIQNAEPPK